VTVFEADGPLGLEARHIPAELDGTPRLTMGDVTAWPRYKIRDIAGLYDLPESEDNYEDNTEAIGATPLPSTVRTVNVTYTVDVFGRTLQEMRAGARALRLAFGADLVTGLNPIRRMLIVPHPSYGPPDDTVHTFRYRCLQLSPGGDVQERGANAIPSPFGRNYVIGLRQYDPRKYVWAAGAEAAATW
jgi:hypothetical protein